MSSKLNLEGFGTLCIHAGHQKDSNRSHLTPIYATSTYTFDNAEQGMELFMGKQKGHIYGRFGNPTSSETEEKIAALEAFGLKDANGEPLKLKAMLHSSGMAAISTLILGNVKAGEKILTHYSLYGGTQELIEKLLEGLGIETIIADLGDLKIAEETIKNNPDIKLVYLETPANPTLSCVDIEAITKMAKAHNMLVSVDNTFATPYLQQPFKYGVDFVMHSTTKFLNGHGTAVGGVLVGHDNEHMRTRMTKTFRLLGGQASAFDAFVLTNGLRTLHVRMDRHCENAVKVAEFLAKHPAIGKVNYLGLADHPDHALCQKQMKHPGAMMSFELNGGFEAGKKFIDGLQMCVSAVSLGTCDTLISHPASTTHAGVPAESRKEYGITDGLVRISVGIEAVNDIIADLENALKGL